MKSQAALLVILAIALVGGPAIWVSLQPREPDLPRHERLQAQETGYYSGGPECSPTRARTPSGPESASERQGCSEAREDHRLKEDDLQQQTRSADAAQSAVWYAYNQSTILVAGTILGFLTLVAAGAAAYYARKAAIHTETAAGVAQSALDDSRKGAVAEAKRYEAQTKLAVEGAATAKLSADAAIAVQRPWLRPSVTAFRMEFYPDGLRLHIEATVAMTNVGSTPTKIEWIPEFKVGFMANHELGHQRIINHLKEQVQFHPEINRMENHLPIYPGETEEWPHGNAFGETFPPATAYNPMTGETSHWNVKPGFGVYLAVGIRYPIPGGEGRSRCFYAIENADKSPIEPFGAYRDDFVLVPLKTLFHIE